MRYLLSIVLVFLSAQSYSQKIRTVLLDLGDKKQPVNIYTYKDRDDIVMVNVHDDERTSLDAAHAVLSKTGGKLIRIDNKQKRFLRFIVKKKIYEFDPNRMFSVEGIRKSLDERGEVSEKAVEEVQEFAKRFLKLIPEDLYCLVALHNNTDGRFSVNYYKPGGLYEKDAAAYKIRRGQDSDDFFFSTDSLLYSRLYKAGYNSVWQDNVNAAKDGSLSVYYGEKNKRYINCETQHGKLTQNIRMLKKLVEILAQLY